MEKQIQHLYEIIGSQIKVNTALNEELKALAQRFDYLESKITEETTII